LISNGHTPEAVNKYGIRQVNRYVDHILYNKYIEEERLLTLIFAGSRADDKFLDSYTKSLELGKRKHDMVYIRKGKTGKMRYKATSRTIYKADGSPVSEEEQKKLEALNQNHGKIWGRGRAVHDLTDFCNAFKIDTSYRGAKTSINLPPGL